MTDAKVLKDQILKLRHELERDESSRDEDRRRELESRMEARRIHAKEEKERIKHETDEFWAPKREERLKILTEKRQLESEMLQLMIAADDKRQEEENRLKIARLSWEERTKAEDRMKELKDRLTKLQISKDQATAAISSKASACTVHLSVCSATALVRCTIVPKMEDGASAEREASLMKVLEERKGLSSRLRQTTSGRRSGSVCIKPHASQRRRGRRWRTGFMRWRENLLSLRRIGSRQRRPSNGRP